MYLFCPVVQEAWICLNSIAVLTSSYPSQKTAKEEDGSEVGVVGNVLHLQNSLLAEQPICAFDWSADKLGLFACASFDQQVRIGMVTRLNNL
jgi:hypothetical protein